MHLLSFLNSLYNIYEMFMSLFFHFCRGDSFALGQPSKQRIVSCFCSFCLASYNRFVHESFLRLSCKQEYWYGLDFTPWVCFLSVCFWKTFRCGWRIRHFITLYTPGLMASVCPPKKRQHRGSISSDVIFLNSMYYWIWLRVWIKQLFIKQYMKIKKDSLWWCRDKSYQVIFHIVVVHALYIILFLVLELNLLFFTKEHWWLQTEKKPLYDMKIP